MPDINVTDYELRSAALEYAARSTEPTSAFAGGNTADQGAAFILKRAARFEHYLRTGSTNGLG